MSHFTLYNASSTSFQGKNVVRFYEQRRIYFIHKKDAHEDKAKAIVA